MSTVSKEIADAIIAGEYEDDPPALKIVKYLNAWGGDSYGVIYVGQDPDKYAPSDYIRNPTIYWEPK